MSNLIIFDQNHHHHNVRMWEPRKCQGFMEILPFLGLVLCCLKRLPQFIMKILFKADLGRILLVEKHLMGLEVQF